MISDEFTAGLHTLGIVHERTLPLSPHQNGKQENLWATLEGRLMAMIGSTKDLTLEQLNLLTQVWLEQDYHRKRHSEIATTPLQRFTDSDGTCSLEGKRFEIPSRFGKLEYVTLSYARWDLSRVEMIDPDTGAMLSRVYPLDKQANANGVRRARESAQHSIEQSEPMDAPLCAVDEQGLSPLMRKLLREYAATGKPPGFIPSPTTGTSTTLSIDDEQTRDNATS